jgi:hypothetical protein
LATAALHPATSTSAPEHLPNDAQVAPVELEHATAAKTALTMAKEKTAAKWRMAKASRRSGYVYSTQRTTGVTAPPA